MNGGREYVLYTVDGENILLNDAWKKYIGTKLFLTRSTE